jgi:folylpolyglutamate synthase/dihydropteroate synthase
MSGLTLLDFFDPRNLHKPSLESLQQLAVKWGRLKAGMTVTVENSIKGAMNAVQNKYDHQGAQILVVGSVYQAGAVIVMLKAGEQGNRTLGALGLE